jgi:hypothetical protein
MKAYRGDRTLDGLQVSVGDSVLDPRLDVKTISENGFEWGYEGPEPTQLALAILCDHFDDNEKAVQSCDAFMKAVVANFNNEWEMTTEDVDTALKNIGCA